MAETTYWNGDPTPAMRGTAVVASAPQFPRYWASHLIGQRIAVVRVDYYGVPMYLDNRYGDAWHKVTAGLGSPRLGHKNVIVEPDSFRPDGVGA